MATAVPIAEPSVLLAQLEGLTDEQALQQFLQRHSQISPRAVVERFSEEVTRVVAIDLDQADRLATTALRLSEAVEDDYCRARSRRAAGHVLFTQGHYRQALEQYQTALSLFEKLAEESEAGRTLSSALQTLIYLGRYQEALTWAQKARAIFEKLGDRLRLARLHLNMGNIYCRQDRFAEALELYGRAYDDLVKHGQPQDVATVLQNMASCHVELGDFDRAIDAYQQARTYCRLNGLSLASADVDYNIASLHYRRGDFTRAIELYQAAREQCVKLGDHYHKALCDLDQAEMFLEMNRHTQSATLSQQAASSFQELGMDYEAAKALTTLAIAADNKGQSAYALKTFSQARDLFTKEQNRVWPQLVDIYRGLALYQEGRHNEARRLCEDAIRRLRSHAENERREWKNLFGRYLSPEVANEVWNQKSDEILTAQERTATVLISDIRNFTAITAGKPPKEALAWLNNYLTAMSEVVQRNGGLLNKFIGDGMLVVFGLPVSEGEEEDARRAVRTALEMLEQVEGINARRSPDEPPIQIGIGIHTGQLIAGNVGSHDRLEYSVIGETVNLASRLEELTKFLQAGILISDQTRDALGDQFSTEPLGARLVRGFQEKILLHAVLSSQK